MSSIGIDFDLLTVKMKLCNWTLLGSGGDTARTRLELEQHPVGTRMELDWDTAMIWSAHYQDSIRTLPRPGWDTAGTRTEPS